MDTLADMIDRRDALAADSLCEEALARFIREPAAMALAVVEAGAPVGLVSRESFMARMETPGAGQLPIRDFMDGAPTLASCDTLRVELIEQMLADSPQALLSGFIVTDAAGGYLGVGTAVSLLAAGGHGGVRQPEFPRLIERIAEELREPVLGTLSIAEQLRALRLPEGADAGLDAITEASGGILALLETASDLQKVEAGRFMLAPEPRRLQELMDDVEGRWRARAHNVGARLLVSYDGDPDCAALIDAPRLLRVFDALIGHALAHVRHGVVEASLKTRVDADGVSVSGAVRDNGARYTPQYLAQLFDVGRPED